MQQEKSVGNYWLLLALKFICVAGIFSLARVLFFFCNYKFFCDETFFDIILAFLVGIRFDMPTVAIFNLPFWIFWSLPTKLRFNKILNFLANTGFFSLSFLALLPNLIDSKYFFFTFRRMGCDILGQAVLLTESASVYADMFKNYWYVVAVGIALAYLLFLAAFKINLSSIFVKIRKRDYIYFFVSIAILVICVRGGFQRKPLKPVDSNIYAPTLKTASLANNTAFNILRTKDGANLPPFKYFANCNKWLTRFSPRHEKGKFCRSCADYKGKNVFIIILESFSAEHIGALDNEFKDGSQKTFTPFLDSLISKSYIFDGFANGASSVDGLTSIVMSIPRLFDSSFITSSYAGNRTNSIASIIKKDGYKTLFFYGGKRNSCNFDSVRTKSEIDEYYCQYEYDGPSSDISGWGVYDEEFFQFVAKKINETQRPFLSVLFTLSSHHPFLYPESLHGNFPSGDGISKQQELIAYTDYSLRRFFETAEKMDWYKNTIFVLVADHISDPHRKYYKNSLGRYSIPIVFFDPNGKLVGKADKVAQQIDIMPTILDLVGSEQNYFAFGGSLFDDSADRFAISFADGVYQLITKDFVCRFDGEKVVGLYKRTDFLLEKNLVDDENYFNKMCELRDFIEAYLQQYSESIINNDMIAE